MGDRSRGRLSADSVREMWQRYKAGESVSSIARTLRQPLGSVYRRLRAAGGVAEVARKRSGRSLRRDERDEISRNLAAGLSFGAIARQLNRPVSTISREVSRNGGRDAYRAGAADQRAWDRARRPKRCRLAQRRRLSRMVASKLCQRWSPQQISGWLKWEYEGIDAMQISHETIYQSLYVQARGALKQELLTYLRSGRRMRRARAASGRQQGRGRIVNAVPISQRPAEAADRAVPGHWEGDLIVGANNSYIITLVERGSRFVMLIRIKTKDAPAVAAALIEKIKTLPAELRRSLTWDRGTEMALHNEIALAARIDIYFCDPKSPWQKGSNENTNGLLRQYFPKGTDLAVHSQAKLNAVARELNERPRQTLGFRSPAQVYCHTLALTG